MFNREPSSSYDTKNPLLSLELRFDTLEAASASVHASKSIPKRVARCSRFRRESSSVEKGDELYDSLSAGRQRLSSIVRSSAPLIRTKLLQTHVEGIEEGSALSLCPSVDKIPRRPMYTLIVGSNGARCALDNNDHVVGDKLVIAVEGKPRRASSPAATLKARGKYVIKRGRAFGRAVGEARRPVCARKMSLCMLYAQVNDAGHRCARVR